MEIGIIVHSLTGNTYSVAQKLEQTLSKAGHHVVIEKIIVAGEENPQDRHFQIETAPDTNKYEALCFCAPVRAFSLSPVMTAYLNQISSLKGKKVACFVTMQFPFAWMGGKHAISQMKRNCNLKNTEVIDTGIIGWSSKQREDQISATVEKLSKVFG